MHQGVLYIWGIQLSCILIYVQYYEKNSLTARFLHTKESFVTQFFIVEIPKILCTAWRPFVFIPGIIHDAIDSSTGSPLSVSSIGVFEIVVHPKCVADFVS